MARQDTLETRFTASIVQFENELRRLQRLNSQAANKLAADQARAAKQAEAAWSKTNIGKAMSRQMADATAVIKNYATVIAGAFAGREALNAAEEWTSFTNTLKVAGSARSTVA
jgi:peptidoglycan hydrolase CwlO-like protein